jgi:hypothetical protein
MDTEEFHQKVAGGDVWDSAIPTHYPKVVNDASEVFMERTSLDGKPNAGARALVLTSSMLWQFDMSRPRGEFRVVAHAEPLGAITMEQEMEADDAGSMGAITAFETTLKWPSGWSVTVPLEGKLGEKRRKRAIEFVNQVLQVSAKSKA